MALPVHFSFFIIIKQSFIFFLIFYTFIKIQAISAFTWLLEVQ